MTGYTLSNTWSHYEYLWHLSTILIEALIWEYCANISYMFSLFLADK